MINPYFILSGIGMMLAGLLPVLWWRYRTLVPWRDFWLGAGVWVLAIGLKAVLDLTVTPLFVNWLTGIYTALGIAIITGAYVGLRTGLFESGFTYLVAIKKQLKKYDFQQAVAFGLGFGAAEAFTLGLLSFLNVAVLLAFPQIIDLVPTAERAAILEQLTLPTIMVIAPIIERVFTILVHIFCSVLVIQSIKSGRMEYFLLSFLYKTGLDGMLPFLTMTFDTTTVAGLYSIEAFVVVLGSISLAGMFWLRGGYGRQGRHKTGRKKFMLSVAAITAIIVIAAVLSAHPNVASKLERRTVNFDDFQGRYDFSMNGSRLGYAEFEFVGVTEYGGKSAFMIKEETNLSSEAYRMYIEGVLYTTVDAHPLFYNMTIHKNGDTKNVVCEFADGFVGQTVNEANKTTTARIITSQDSFIIANNMISHWALMFRATKLEPKNTYIAHLYSPNAEMDIVRSFEVVGVDTMKVKGKTYDVYVFREQLGNFNYVTPDGLLLKIENPVLEIVLSDGGPEEEGGIFR